MRSGGAEPRARTASVEPRARSPDREPRARAIAAPPRVHVATNVLFDSSFVGTKQNNVIVIV